MTHFLAWRNGMTVGRISAAVNRRFNEYYGSRIGFFGFFETVEDFDVARSLLDRAREWVDGARHDGVPRTRGVLQRHA